MKKSIIVFAILSISFLSGCGQVERSIAMATGYSKICVSGVSYIQFSSGATVQVDRSGKPVSCEN